LSPGDLMDSEIIEKLSSIVGFENCKTTTAELYTYSMDAGIHKSMPDAVIRPHSAKEVSEIVLLANEWPQILRVIKL